MGYFILYLIIAIWVFFDAKKRQNHAIGWPLASVLVGPITLPVYFAKRNLKEGEIREGGTAWNILKNFALFWTLTMMVCVVGALISTGAMMNSTGDEYEQAGMAIGATIGIGFIAGLWFFGLIGALALGLFLKKSTVVEKGPTGPLASSLNAVEKIQEASPPARSTASEVKTEKTPGQDILTKVQCSDCQAIYTLKKPPPQRTIATCKKCNGKIIIEPLISAFTEPDRR
jgi:hypothetical protein